MKLGTALTILVAACALVLALHFVVSRDGAPGESASNGTEASAENETPDFGTPQSGPLMASPAETGPTGNVMLSPASAPGKRAGDAAEEDHEAYVAIRTDELFELAADKQPAGLQAILLELTNRYPEIRQAALQATTAFGSREAIPRLQEVLTQTDDPKEKAAIEDAIEFLNLPSLTEVMRRPGLEQPSPDRPAR